jgi:hypothetical protein
MAQMNATGLPGISVTIESDAIVIRNETHKTVVFVAAKTTIDGYTSDIEWANFDLEPSLMSSGRSYPAHFPVLLAMPSVFDSGGPPSVPLKVALDCVIFSDGTVIGRDEGGNEVEVRSGLSRAPTPRMRILPRVEPAKTSQTGYA